MNLAQYPSLLLQKIISNVKKIPSIILIGFALPSKHSSRCLDVGIIKARKKNYAKHPSMRWQQEELGSYKKTRGIRKS